MNRRVPLVAAAIALVTVFAAYHFDRDAGRRGPGHGGAERWFDESASPVRLEAWSFADLEGRNRKLDDWAGKLMVVNFWATWCLPCKQEIPGFVALQQRYAVRGVQVIGIAVDEVGKVVGYAREQGINYPLLVGQDDVIAFMQDLGNDIGALPYTAVIDRDGRLRVIHRGVWASHDLERTIAAIR